MRNLLQSIYLLGMACAILSCSGCNALCNNCDRYADFTLPAPETSGPGAFAWEPASGPVIARDAATDVLNPSVVAWDGSYLNLYSEFDGDRWHTASATSNDGVTWTKQGRVLSPEADEGDYIAANGSALVRDSGNDSADAELLYWYQITAPATDQQRSKDAPPRIALALSSDGLTWTRHGEAVLHPGPRGSFDERGVADPYVIEADGILYMFYLGQDRARRQRLGLARSSDGVEWEKLRQNPVLGFSAAGAIREVGEPGSFDENGLGEPAVWSSGGSWWMLYTGRAANEQRRMGLAKSADGVAWERVPQFAPISGTEAWDSQVVCDPALIQLPGGDLRVWFGGGNVASPDENLNGQIGMGLLRGLD